MSKKTKKPKKGTVTWASQIWYEGTTNQFNKWLDAVLDLPQSKRLTLGIHGRIFDEKDTEEGTKMYDNAAERAITRLEKDDVPYPWGPNQSHTHGYRRGLRHAVRILNEELNRNHGL